MTYPCWSWRCSVTRSHGRISADRFSLDAVSLAIILSLFTESNSSHRSFRFLSHRDKSKSCRTPENSHWVRRSWVSIRSSAHNILFFQKPIPWERGSGSPSAIIDEAVIPAVECSPRLRPVPCEPILYSLSRAASWPPRCNSKGFRTHYLQASFTFEPSPQRLF